MYNITFQLQACYIKSEGYSSLDLERFYNVTCQSEIAIGQKHRKIVVFHYSIIFLIYNMV